MMNEEVIQVLDDMKAKTDIPKSAVTQLKRNTALDVAIKAVEKQIPKKPIPKKPKQEDYFTCPNCESYLIYGDQYCQDCGQCIDWSEEEEE